MGEVYRARDTRLDRTVAIKVLPPHLSDRPEAKERFEREARAISLLNHPNICHLYDIGSQDGISYLVMEYLEGETLAARLAKGPLAVEQVLRYGVELAEGLETAHRSAVVHRDLKPGNVMLTKSGAKLMDFGLAKPVASANPPSSGLTLTLANPSQPLTAEGTVVGTFQYMSPEQVEGKDADARSDIFALGAVLYEMVTGKRAFEGKTTASVLAAVLERQPPPVSSILPLTPQALDHAIKKCLAKDPEERWQSARDVASELRWIAEGETQSAVLARIAGRRLRETVLAGVALLFAMATLFLGFEYFRRPPNDVASFRASILPPENNSFSSGIGAGGYALSPDGAHLAFVAQSVDGKAGLWIRALNSLVAQPLPGTENASLPFWSPDGQWIAFFAEGKLRKTQASGGSVQEICDASLGRGGTWSVQGTIVFSPNISSSLFRVSANGGTPVPVTAGCFSR
jgi:serine/threonine protein kinase